MIDKFTKAVLIGILVLLAVIAFRQPTITIQNPTPNVSVENPQQFVQIAPNRIGLVDTGIHSGIRGQLIVFDYIPDTNTFQYVNTLNASYVLDHPEEFGIPTAGPKQ
jgi:hypothetical protein